MKKPTVSPNRFCFAEHAIISQSDDGWVALKTDGTSDHMTDAEFSRRSFAIDCEHGENGFYAILDNFREHASFAYRVDAAAGLVWLENGPVPVGIHDFLMTTVRADAQGRPVCSFLSTAEDQLYACTEAAANAHVSEIIEGTTAFGAVLVEDWMEAARSRSEALDSAEILSMVA